MYRNSIVSSTGVNSSSGSFCLPQQSELIRYARYEDSFPRSCAQFLPNPGEYPTADHPGVTGVVVALAQLHTRAVPPETLAEAELKRGQDADPRVSRAQMDEIACHYRMAQNHFFRELAARRDESQMNILLAPTSRVVDHFLDESGTRHLFTRLEKEGRLPELLEMVDKGPPGGGVVWDEPRNPLELLASQIRWSVLHNGDKKRLRPTAEVRSWIGETLDAAEYNSKPRLGGISAVCAAFAPVLARSPSMLALGMMPSNVTEHLPKNLKVISSDPAVDTIDQLPTDAVAAAHYALLCSDLSTVMPEELAALSVNGRNFPRESWGKIDTLITGVKSPSGFGNLPLERMHEIGQKHTAGLLTGLQTLDSTQAISDYFSHVRSLHEAGMYTALSYAESKFPAAEMDAIKVLAHCTVVDYFSLNAVEAYELLKRIALKTKENNPLALDEPTSRELERTLETGAAHPVEWEAGYESPQWLFQSASVLQKILHIPLVRVRGKVSDVLMVAENVEVHDPEAMRDTMIVSRILATTKVADESGLIDGIADLAFLNAIPDGLHVAALHPIQDEITRYNATLSGSPSAEGVGAKEFSLPFTCFARLADGRFCFAVPPVPFLDKRGGTQSAGDIMDITFVSEAVSSLLKAAHDSQA